jgi:hypothetical protein
VEAERPHDVEPVAGGRVFGEPVVARQTGDEPGDIGLELAL